MAATQAVTHESPVQARLPPQGLIVSSSFTSTAGPTGVPCGSKSRTWRASYPRFQSSSRSPVSANAMDRGHPPSSKPAEGMAATPGPGGVPAALNQRRKIVRWSSQATAKPPPGAAAALNVGQEEDVVNPPRGVVLTSKSGPRGLPEGENRRARRTRGPVFPGGAPSQTATKAASARPTTDTPPG